MVREKEDTLYVVMPSYNEEDSIRQVVISWLKVLKNGSKESRLVVADSGSTDKTHDILLDLKKEYKQLEILKNTNQFHGPKVIALYKYAIEKGANYIFQTDSDGQTNPNEFNSFWKERKKYDGILGYRKTRGDGQIRAFVERVVCFLLGVFFGVSVPDANAPFRLMSVSLVKKYIHRIPKDYALPNIILTAYFVRFGEKVSFNEISFAPRTKGKNSINIKKIIKIGFESLFAFFLFRRDMKILEAGSLERYKSNRRKKIWVILCFIIISFILVAISPAFFWNSGNPLTDSSVFLTVGRQMKNGGIPYVDTFDHKGPLLYLINYFGIMIEDISGVFIFEFLAIFFTLFFMFKIVKIRVSSYTISVILTVLLFSPFVSFYLSDWGNLVEQYALPLISFSLYIFLKYLLGKNISVFETIFVGVAFASVLMLRVNMAGIWIIFCLTVFAKNMYEKKYIELWKNVLYFIIGAFIVILPIVVWLLINNAFSAFIDVYIRFNMEYSSAGNLNSIVLSILNFMNDAIILLSFVITIYYAFGVRKNYTMILYLVIFIVSLVAACMSGKSFPHYGMVLVPLTAFPFASLFTTIEKSNQLNSVGIIGIMFLISLVSPNWLSVARRLYGDGMNDGSDRVLVSKVCEYIEEKTSLEENVIVYGNWNQIYIKCNRMPASKYSYQFPISEVRPSILNDFYNDLSINKPKVFVIQPGFMDERVRIFLKDNNYKEEWVENNDGVRVYSLKTDKV